MWSEKISLEVEREARKTQPMSAAVKNTHRYTPPYPINDEN
jgi:hypothetical protein